VSRSDRGADVAIEASTSRSCVAADPGAWGPALCALAPHDGVHPPEPVLGVRVQRGPRSGREWASCTRVRDHHQPGDGRRRHGAPLGVRDLQLVAPARLRPRPAAVLARPATAPGPGFATRPTSAWSRSRRSASRPRHRLRRWLDATPRAVDLVDRTTRGAPWSGSRRVRTSGHLPDDAAAVQCARSPACPRWSSTRGRVRPSCPLGSDTGNYALTCAPADSAAMPGMTPPPFRPAGGATFASAPDPRRPPAPAARWSGRHASSGTRSEDGHGHDDRRHGRRPPARRPNPCWEKSWLAAIRRPRTASRGSRPGTRPQERLPAEERTRTPAATVMRVSSRRPRSHRGGSQDRVERVGARAIG